MKFCPIGHTNDGDLFVHSHQGIKNNGDAVIKLTNKQSSVLVYLVENPLDTVSEVADNFYNSENTIKQDLKGLYRAFDVSGRNARRDLVEKAQSVKWEN